MLALTVLTPKDKEQIKALFYDVFTSEPWNDDWSDSAQLDGYIEDLICNRNSLAYGMTLDGELVAISLGHTKRWYEGTEYFIDEFCVKNERQGEGIGSRFFELIGNDLKTRNVNHIFLLTERHVPAFEFYKKCGFTELQESVSFTKFI